MWFRRYLGMEDKVILNLSVDILLKVSQAFKTVLLIMVKHISELTELNFWEKDIQITRFGFFSLSHPEELAVPAPCKKRSGRHPLLIKHSCMWGSYSSLLSFSRWSFSALLWVWQLCLLGEHHLGQAGILIEIWDAMHERKQTPCTGWWSSG